MSWNCTFQHQWNQLQNNILRGLTFRFNSGKEHNRILRSEVGLKQDNLYPIVSGDSPVPPMLLKKLFCKWLDVAPSKVSIKTWKKWGLHYYISFVLRFFKNILLRNRYFWSLICACKCKNAKTNIDDVIEEYKKFTVILFFWEGRMSDWNTLRANWDACS